MLPRNKRNYNPNSSLPVCMLPIIILLRSVVNPRSRGLKICGYLIISLSSFFRDGTEVKCEKKMKKIGTKKRKKFCSPFFPSPFTHSFPSIFLRHDAAEQSPWFRLYCHSLYHPLSIFYRLHLNRLFFVFRSSFPLVSKVPFTQMADLFEQYETEFTSCLRTSEQNVIDVGNLIILTIE